MQIESDGSTQDLIMPSVITEPKLLLLQPPAGMPELSPDVRTHGKRIIDALTAKLQASNNWLSFADYMRFCLYEPEVGYYSAGLQKFGSAGDFVTAPEISPIFGECLAEAISGLLIKHPDWSICELGPGRGRLASSVLRHLQTLKALPKSYQLLDVSAQLRNIQKKELDSLQIEIPIEHLDRPPVNFKGIIIANEVIDALVVERFHIDAQGTIQQCGISLENERLVESYKPAPAHLTAAIQSLETDLPNNYTSEICTQLKPWLSTLTENSDECILLFSDYGLSQKEYYSPERKQGTLRCHYQQHAHNDYLVLPALQDLTAWVNFTQLGDAALSLGMEVTAYTTQAHFLLGSGRLQQLDFESMPEKERFQTSRDIQTLTLPANMGERFRFMQLNKNCDEQIPAVAFRDLRHLL